MLNLPRLTRLAHAGQFTRMIDEVLRSGPSLPIGVRLRLSDPEGLPATGCGLALQRAVQLTYRPTNLSLELVHQVIRGQREDGSFGSLSATAVALAGLFAFFDQVRSLPGGKNRTTSVIDPDLYGSIEHAIGAALHRLHRAQEESSFGSRRTRSDLIGDDLDTSIILWQLALEPRFTRVVRFEALLDAVERRGLRHDRCVSPLLGLLVFAPREQVGPAESSTRAA